MKLGYRKFGKTWLKSFAFFILLAIFTFPAFPKTQAAEYIAPDSCTFQLHFIGPDGAKKPSDHIDIPKSQSSGYKAEVRVSGSGCGNPYMGYYHSTGGPNNSDIYKSTCDVARNGLVLSDPLDFSNTSYTNFTFNYYVWRGKECSASLGSSSTFIKTLQITATLTGAAVPPAPPSPAADCGCQLFFTDDKGTQFKDARQVVKGTTGYKITGKINKRDPGKAYTVRITRLIDGKKDGDNYKVVVPPTKGNSAKEQEFTSSIDFPKNGAYTFYFDYDDANSTTYSNLAQISITVADAASQTNTGPVNTQYKVGEVDYDASFGFLDNLINFESIPEFIAGILRLFFLGLGGFAILMILIGSIRMIMSRGNTEAISAGKKTVTWAIIGFIVALLSYSMVAILQSVLGVQ